MNTYVDGFLIPLPKDKVDEYVVMAKAASEIWKEYGALEYYECLGDDLDAENMVSFRKAAGASDEETVVLSWIVYRSKEDRDRVNALVMEDTRIKEMMEKGPAPFDCSRMVFGGFKTLIGWRAA
jgi:uncharacterized protein YbaA (DUF1428 family)